MFTCKLKKGLKWEYYRSTDRMSRLRVGEIPSAVWQSEPPSGENPRSGVGPLSRGNPISRVGFTVASEWEKSHQRSRDLDRDLK